MNNLIVWLIIILSSGSDAACVAERTKPGAPRRGFESKSDLFFDCVLKFVCALKFFGFGSD